VVTQSKRVSLTMPQFPIYAALTAVTWSVALSSSSAFGEDRGCALSVDAFQLCLSRNGSSTECLTLRRDRHPSAGEFRCLVRSFETIGHCYGMTIAQNALVRLQPFRGRYEMLIYPNPSTDFYDEIQIRNSCRAEQGER
jgi:hypothetical protein